LKNWWARAGAGLTQVTRHKMVWLMVGGAVGTYCRYWVARWFNTQPWGQTFPYGTFVINVSGSFILGVAAAFLVERMPEHQNLWLLIGTGFCGGYTTFSTFSWETARLIRDGSWPLAVVNSLGSVLAGLVGVFLALALIDGFFPRR
jgi:fluoride exporter